MITTVKALKENLNENFTDNVEENVVFRFQLLQYVYCVSDFHAYLLSQTLPMPFSTEEARVNVRPQLTQ